MNQVDMDALLDGSLDDIADLPEFKTYPAGFHKVSIVITQKEINKKAAFEVAMTYIEALELADPTEVPPAVGDTSNLVFFPYNEDGSKNELGQGQFKLVLNAVKSLAAEGATNREIIAASQGAVVAVSLGQRVDKNDATKIYSKLNKIDLV